MEKLLLSFLLPLVFFQAKTQTSVYHPFPDSNAVWSEVYSYMSGNMFPDVSYTNFVMQNDTIIGGHTYKKLIKYIIGYQWSNNNYAYYTGGSSNYYAGAIRQDSALKRVYYITDSIETILYDFNMNIGDTVINFYQNVDTDIVVASIDSILMGNEYHKRFNFVDSNSANVGQIIEGMGSTLGLFGYIMDSASYFEQAWHATCFTVANQSLYYYDPNIPLNGWDGCSVLTRVKNLKIQEIVFNLCPNPSNGIFNISTSEKISQIKIYDLLGNLFYETNDAKKQINLSEKAKGIYFVHLIQDNKTMATEKIIITE